jgi:ParB-like chromosome segregation protein Spo0J
MLKLEPHPLSKLFPLISEDDFYQLVADIKLNGLHHPIVRYQGMILDGNHRYRACELLKITAKFAPDFTGDNAAARNYVISANIHRRHLDPDDRKRIAAELLKLEPTKSNRQLGEETKLDHKTVGNVRAELEATGEIPQLESTTGADNKVRKRKPRKPKVGGEKEKITYQKVTNASTALNAYRLFEGHLLDALQDVSEHSDFSQADELAQATIAKLQERLSEMQPEEKEADAA